jgi:hypothetical protein
MELDELDSHSGSISAQFSDCDYCQELYVDRNSDDEIDTYPFQFVDKQEQKIERTAETIKVEIYERECQRYRIGTINLVKDGILGNIIDVDLKNYGVRSLHLQMIFKILETSPTSRIRTLDLTNNEFSKFACSTLNDLMESSIHLNTLILKGCK